MRSRHGKPWISPAADDRTANGNSVLYLIHRSFLKGSSTRPVSSAGRGTPNPASIFVQRPDSFFPVVVFFPSFPISQVEGNRGSSEKRPPIPQKQYRRYLRGLVP